MKHYNLVGDKLRKLLKEHGKSNRELAYQTGAPDWTWSKIINGKARLNVDLAIRLGKVFPLAWDSSITKGCSIQYWLEMQHESDVENSKEQDGPMYIKIKPFEAN